MGVHVSGNDKKEINYAVRLTSEVRAIINCWASEKGQLILGK